MRNGDHAVQIEQRVAREIGHIAADAAVAQRVHQRRLVHEAAARKVHDAHALAADGQAAGADHAAGLLVERHVQGDEVALGEQRVQRVFPLDLLRQLPRVLDGDHRVVADDVHAQMHGGIGHQHADGAQTDHAQRLAAQLRADEGLLALLHGLFHRGALALERARPLDAAHDVAAGEQHAGQYHLGDGVGVRARRVEHADALLAARVHRNVVVARAGAGDAQHAVVNRRLVHGGGAHQHGLRMGHIVGDLVLLIQLRVDRGGNRIECLDSVFHGRCPPSYLLFISNSFMNSTSAFTPSTGMAL